MRRAALLIVAFVLLTSCTTAVPGTAAVAPVPSLGPRPRELRLDGIDPCSLLTSAQAAALGLEDSSRRHFDAVPPAPGPACLLAGFKPRAISVGLILGATTALSDLTRPGALSDDLTLMIIRGFPAVLARPRNTYNCYVDVGVAERQVLDIVLSDGGGSPPIAQDQLCRDVVGVAEQAMSTLLTS